MTQRADGRRCRELEQRPARRSPPRCDAGGNAVRVGDIRLLVGDRASVLEQARDAAVAEATAKAEQYAEATGQSLGDVLSLREVRARARGRRTRWRFESPRAADAAKVPIEAGENELKVTVRVVWLLRLSPTTGPPMRHAGERRTRRHSDRSDDTKRHARAWHRRTT